MAIYSNSAFGEPYKEVKRIVTDVQPNYLFGSFNVHTQPWLFNITNVTIAANVAIIAGTLKSGGGASLNDVPQVGAKVGVRGTTVNGGVFNVDPTTAATVTYTKATGLISVTFPLTGANFGTTASAGDLVVQPFETGDLVAAGTASAPLALIFTPDESDNSRCLYAEASWSGTLPTGATVALQVANVDDDSRYAVVQNVQGTLAGAHVAISDNIASIATSAVTQSGAQYSFIMGKFIRAKVLTMAGGDATTRLTVSVFV